MAGNLKLENYSDREILHIVADVADNAGWAEVEHIAERVGLRADGMSETQLLIHSRRCVSVRLAWIRKLSGTVDRHQDKTKLQWCLTPLGIRIVTAKLSTVISDRLDAIGEGEALMSLDVLARRYNRAEAGVGNLMRREWAYGTHRNRRG